MLARLLWASLQAMLAFIVAPQLAHADVYTWVDKSGSVNVSNLAPPEGSRVTSVIHATAAETAAREAAIRDAARQAEVQALAERVRQLEGEVQLASRSAPPQVEYRALPAPPIMPPIIQYIAEPAPPAVQYSAYASPPVNYGCDLSGIDCGVWGFPYIYPSTVVVLQARNVRRHPDRNMHQVPSPHPVAASQPAMRWPTVFRKG